MFRRRAQSAALGPGGVGNFKKRLGERRIIGRGGGEIADRLMHEEDLIGGFLDLADALEIAGRAVIIFDPDAE